VVAPARRVAAGDLGGAPGLADVIVAVTRPPAGPGGVCRHCRDRQARLSVEASGALAAALRTAKAPTHGTYQLTL